jgi:hypothetical protein
MPHESPALTTAFEDVPDNARAWVIGIDRPLARDEQELVRLRLTSFFEKWTAHGRPVVARSDVVLDRFILIAAFVPGDDVSGCGIDASVHEIDNISELVGFSRAPVLDIFFLDGPAVKSVSRQEFAHLVHSGTVRSDTTVFDTSVSMARDLKQGRFVLPFSESWHASVFDSS